MTPDDAEIRARASLYDFVRWMYRAQHNKTIVPASHHSLVCSALERVIRGKTKRLIINIPPRSGKTLLVSQLFPAFWMGLNPASNFILTSYSKTLASNNTYAVREIMRHEAYQWLWRDTKPQIKDDSQARDIFRTNANGMVYGVGSGGTITGIGAGDMGNTPAGCIIIDDPIKPDEALSDTVRNSTIEWFRGTLESRKNSPDTPIVVVMQRLHELDLAGWLESGGNGEEWDVIKIPALKDDGTSFWERQFPVEMLRRLEKSSPYTFAGQYMQEPSPRGGGFFKPYNIDIIDTLPEGVKWVRGWDMAATANGGDWTCGAKLGVKNDVIYIADVRRVQGSPDEVERLIVNTAKMDDCLQSIPQDPGAAGKSVVAYMSKKLHGAKFKFSLESGDKATRAEPLASQINIGNARMLKADWNESFVHELASFPNGAHDDQVDAASRAYSELMGYKSSFVTRRLF